MGEGGAWGFRGKGYFEVRFGDSEKKKIYIKNPTVEPLDTLHMSQ